MYDFYDKVSDTVRLLVITILEYSDTSNGPQDGTEDPQRELVRLEDNAIESTRRKSGRNKNLFYQFFKSAKIKAKTAEAEKSNFLNKFDQLKDESKFYIDDSARDQSPIQDKEDTITQDSNIKIYKIKSNNDVDISGNDVSWLLD